MTAIPAGTNKMGSVLYSCIFISLLPVLFVSSFYSDLAEGMAFNLIVGAGFLLQIFLVVYFFSTEGSIETNNFLLIVAVFFSISQGFTLYLATVLGQPVNIFDYINVFVRFIALLIFVCIPTQFNLSKKSLKHFMLMIVVFGLIACFYNVISNFTSLLAITTITNSYQVNFQSFFVNRNSFAQFLFFSIIANALLYFTTKKKMYLLFFFIIGFNILLTLSRTVTMSVLIFFTVFLVIHYHRYILTQIILLFSFISIATLFILNSTMRKMFLDLFVRADAGTSGRSEIWNTGFEMLSGMNWFFGIGYLTSSSLLEKMGYPSQFHSFYIETLVGGGIIDLLLHFVLFIFVIQRVFTIYKGDQTIGLIYMAGYLGLIFYCFFESASFFSMGYVDSIFRIFFITIPIMYSNNFDKNIDS
ncbi:O-antigen ligase family protein [Halobacillus faecis]